MSQEYKNILRKLFYVLMPVVASMPLTADYMLNVSGNLQWLDVVKGLSPDAPGGALQSFFWYRLPIWLFHLTGSAGFAYRLFLLLIQTGTVATAYCLFRRLFREDTFACFLGTLLYVTCPYRLLTCYEQGNINETVAWMLLPLYVFGCLTAVSGISSLYKWGGYGMIVSALSLWGIGLADNRMLLITAAFTVLACILSRRILPLAGMAAGICLWLPSGMCFLRAVFAPQGEDGMISLQFINGGGYSIGDFFAVFANTPGKPGLGLGLILGLIAAVWLFFLQAETETGAGFPKQAEGSIKFPGAKHMPVILGLLAMLLSMERFPWDIVQRLGGWSLRLVSSLRTPAIFFGFASFAFCIPAASQVSRCSRLRHKLLAELIPLAVCAAALGTAVYLCNALTFSTEPIR